MDLSRQGETLRRQRYYLDGMILASIFVAFGIAFVLARAATFPVDRLGQSTERLEKPDAPLTPR